MVKTIAMIYSIHKKQIESDLEKLSSNRRLRLESLLDQKYSEQTERELECILKRQKELLLKTSEGYGIRTHTPNFEENEPNTSYYSRMEKIKAEGNKIHSLYDKNGILQSKTANVLKIAEDYYSVFFRASETDKRMQNEILSKTKIKINQEQKRLWERNLELLELEQGMDHLPLGKSPGLDCLPVEFYRQLQPIIKLGFFKWCKRFRV